MTPEEKAKELVQKFHPYTFHDKQCAIICCDEIINLHMAFNMGRGLQEEDSEGLFYQKVKIEIAKL